MSDDLDRTDNDSTVIAVMANNIEHIQDDVKNIKETMKGTFVTVERFKGLEEKTKLNQTILFTMLGVILLGFLTAVVNFFIQSSNGST